MLLVHNLQGSNEVENALLDAAYESLLDIRKSFFAARGDAVKSAAFWETDYGVGLAGLEKNIKGPFFNGAKLSYVDVQLYYSTWVVSNENKDAVTKALAANPKVAAIYAAVEKDEKIAAYVAARKVTPF